MSKKMIDANKLIFAWRVTPTQYRLKDTEFKKPEWIKGE